MGFWSTAGKAFLGETAYQTFNNYLSNIVRKRNASIVGPSKQIAGEFPPVDMKRLYEYYHGWDQIKRSIDTMHQKFMGAGIEITSDNDEFDYFMEKWTETVNFQKKMSDFFLSLLITGNAILELQFVEDPTNPRNRRIGNVEQIPMQTIFRFFRDEFANEIKIVQNIDGVFKELDPQYYVHYMINNPDREAFGKSEFHSLAAPRIVSGTVDKDTGIPINPQRTMTPLLDAQAELQNAEVEIKKIMAKPRIFASFPGMPQNQLDKIQKELQDPNSSQTIWAFDKEAKMAEAQIQANSKYDDYGDNVDSHIDIGTGFASKVVSKPGGFSYSSSQTPFDVLDQRMLDLQSDAVEMMKDQILRPVSESWGIEDFDELNVQIKFSPSVRRLTLEDIQKLPIDAVAPKEKRQIISNLQVPLDDSEWEEYQAEMKKQQMNPMGGGAPTQGGLPAKTNPLQSPVSPISPQAGKSPNQQSRTMDPQHKKQQPRPGESYAGEFLEDKIHPILKDPRLLDDYIKETVRDSVESFISNERITLSPKINTSDLYVPGGLNEEDGTPEVTDRGIMSQLLKQFGDDFAYASGKDDNPPQTGNRDLTSGTGNKELDKRIQDDVQVHDAFNYELNIGTDTPVGPRLTQPDTSDFLIGGSAQNNADAMKVHPDDWGGVDDTAYRGRNAPDPNDNLDITGPIQNSEPKKTNHVPKQVPNALNSKIKQELDRKASIDRIKKLLDGDNDEV